MSGLNTVDRGSDSAHVTRVWRSQGPGAKRMLSVTNSNWELVFMEFEGSVSVTVRGPETSPSLVELPEEGSAIGIVFAHGTALEGLPVPRLVDAAVTEPADDAGRRMELGGETWEIPRYDSVEDFVAKLSAAGLLRHDRLVADVAAGADDHGLGPRATQLRVKALTGLTRTAIRQIERARAAAMMLQDGRPIIEAVHELDYYDQPHLSHALSRFIGRTASELRRGDPDVPLSLLYKTPGWPAE
ncbi:AraC family transcriptional regulator [Microbacterium resistens]|uniref:AraC family transcriptional regulator n=1 Tax=Microbacterium resistens TaxID=156977 RepID=A0ABY3RRL0_9MICO|nr:helix-turn-helix domain-containing protein [Microbacterium resistens]UGS26718.1 AraC family transcriptional regulator [Microbacterium resistens]